MLTFRYPWVHVVVVRVCVCVRGGEGGDKRKWRGETGRGKNDTEANGTDDMY